jgi:hypothetical protein
MTKQRRYTLRYIFGLCILPFLIIGYFFDRTIWSYLTKKKPFIEWMVLVLAIAITSLVISGIIRGDFRPGKQPVQLNPYKVKHR